MKRAIVLLSLFLLPYRAHAQNLLTEFEKTEFAVYGSDAPDIFQVIGTIINSLLGVAGVILLVLLIYGGFLWMTAGGNTDQINKAKSVLTNATIGLVIVLASFAIATFVVQSLSA